MELYMGNWPVKYNQRGYGLRCYIIIYLFIYLFSLISHFFYSCLSSLQDLNNVAFRFKDKERPRGYTSKVAGLLHVGGTATVSVAIWKRL